VVSTSLMVDTFSVPSFRNLLCAVNCALTLKRILKLDRLRLRGPNGAKQEFLLAATAQNLRKLAKLIPTSTQLVPA